MTSNLTPKSPFVIVEVMILIQVHTFSKDLPKFERRSFRHLDLLNFKLLSVIHVLFIPYQQHNLETTMETK